MASLKDKLRENMSVPLMVAMWDLELAEKKGIYWEFCSVGEWAAE